MNTLLVIVGGLVLLFVGMRFFLTKKAYASKGKKLDGLAGRIGTSVSAGDRVMAYFYSPSCSACKTQTPLVEKLQREFPNIYKINVAEDMAMARAFGVMATPTTTIVNRGIVEEVLIGAQFRLPVNPTR
jgi:thiol-disulfide isomerase/thioredoxin